MPSKPAPTSEDLVFLDACCLINLFATGHAEEILAALPHRWAVASYVFEQEILAISGGWGEEGSEPEGRTALHPLLAALFRKSVLEIVDIQSAAEQAGPLHSYDWGDEHS